MTRNPVSRALHDIGLSAAQKQLALLQWAVPALTGALVVISSYAGEQERASEVKKGLAQRLIG